MKFRQKFWNKIQNINKLFHLKFLSSIIGNNFLSEEELKFLEKETNKEYKKDTEKLSIFDKIFYFGKYNQQNDNLSISDFNKYSLKNFYLYLESLSDEDKKRILNNEELNRVKQQFYLDILGKQFKIEKDTRQIILNEENNTLGKFRITQIANYIKNRFKDWSNIKTSIQYCSELAFNEGKINQIKEENKEGETYVYKIPILDEKTCSHCKAAYLNSDESPKIFLLNEIIANGTNIGRKEYLPTIGPLHIRCRCILKFLNLKKGTTLEDYIWDGNRYIYKK